MTRSALLIGLVALGASCSTYDERMEPVHRAFYDNELAAAIEELAELEDEEAPDRPVLELELAMVLQAAGRYGEAARLLVRAHDRLEVLDYTSDSLADIADFTFGSKVSPFRASPPERIMVPTQNMLNFLGVGDPEEAAVEARRVRLLLNQSDTPLSERYANPFAWGLAGLSFELAGDNAEALDAYASAPGTPLQDRSMTEGQPRSEKRPGVILIVLQTGHVPIRKETIYLLPVAGQVHRLNVPALVDRPPIYTVGRVTLDGVALGEVPLLFDLGLHMRKRYEQELPRLLAAAATQVIPRSLTAEAVRQAIRHAGSGSSDETQMALAAIAEVMAYLVEWGLAAVARADTRCWSLLPDQVRAVRLNVAPGEHLVDIALDGIRSRSLQFPVEVGPGGVVLVNVTTSLFGGYVDVPDPGQRDLQNEQEGERALDTLEWALRRNQAF